MRTRLHFLLLAGAAAILFLSAIRLGDLAGYDDAMYSLQAKGIALNGNWLAPKCRGSVTFEHPPLFVWTQAAFLETFGISDPVAKLPAALSALGVVLLTFWLTRRLLNDALAASVAMFIMLATPYFIKYAGRAMTDVPATFLFVCAVCAWLLADDDPRWYLAAGLFTAMALLVRGLIGFALPLAFATYLLLICRRPQWRYVLPAFVIAIAPLAAWYSYELLEYPGAFLYFHQGWLQREVYGSLTPAWRRYTGAPEYLWMLAKSYWPWLPAMLAGAIIVIRERRRPLFLLLSWIGAVFILCAAARSRVLRYMLPAYPAFAILAAVALMKWVPRRALDRAMNWAAPMALAAAICIAVLWRPDYHATEIRDIAQAQDKILAAGTPVGLYDKGDPRYDETNQLEWYGHALPVILLTPQDLDQALQAGTPRVFVLDKTDYRARIEPLPHDIIAESGRLISVRLTSGARSQRAAPSLVKAP